EGRVQIEAEFLAQFRQVVDLSHVFVRASAGVPNALIERPVAKAMQLLNAQQILIQQGVQTAPFGALASGGSNARLDPALRQDGITGELPRVLSAGAKRMEGDRVGVACCG